MEEMIEIECSSESESESESESDSNDHPSVHSSPSPRKRLKFTPSQDQDGDSKSDSHKMHRTDSVHHLTVTDALEYLGTDPDLGLTEEEVGKRIKQYGKNELPEKKPNIILEFLVFFWNPLSWVMELAALLSFVLGDYADTLLIATLLILNALIGFFEERSSGNAVAALKSRLAPTAQCLRNGEFHEVTAFGLVPGDIIFLGLGDVVPADVKVISGSSLKIDQASLTGESLPVTKYVGDILLAGSIVQSGEARCMVYATGSNTFFGKAASLVSSTKSQGHFQEILKKIGLFCICFITVGVIIEIIIGFAVYRTECTGLTWAGKDCPVISNILVLLVGGIPIAMPTVLSVTMALGAQKLAKHQAIVSRLTAIEEMAGMDMLCSDKTGTLTLNKLTIGEPILVEGFSEERLLFDAALAAQKISPDAIDYCLLKHFDLVEDKSSSSSSISTKKKKGIFSRIKGMFKSSSEGGEEEYEMKAAHTTKVGLVDDKCDFSKVEVLDIVPFDPVSKRSTATVRDHKGRIFYTTKGAPQVILNLGSNEEDIAEAHLAEGIDDLGSRGYRALGVASTLPHHADEHVDEDNLEWIVEGLMSLYDPPRHDTAEVIANVQQYGIEVKMITGDQMAIAKETCRQLKIGDHILTPDIIDKDIAGATDDSTTSGDDSTDSQSETKKLHSTKKDKVLRKLHLQKKKKINHKKEVVKEHKFSAETINAVQSANGFAQVFPEHKYYIVEALQQRRFVVGMTGDGVNDAPALKKANIGIAVDGATDAARAASDIVLVSPGLGVITRAILGSRKIFQRMRNYSIYSITTTIRIVLTFGILTVGFDFMFPTLLIAIMAILNDGTILTISKDKVKPSQSPDTWSLPTIFILSIVFGTYLSISSILLFVIVDKTSWPEDWFGMQHLNRDEIRALVYLNVSVSGQALIFVTRAQSFFFLSMPSILLMIAFVIAQIAATLIGIFGFNGYPDDGFTDFVGCGWDYAILAWVWSIIWFLPLDLLKIGTRFLLRLFIKRDKIVQKAKHFGHPVYGKHGNKSFHGIWGKMIMEPPEHQQIWTNKQHLDLDGELPVQPWSVSGMAGSTAQSSFMGHLQQAFKPRKRVYHHFNSTDKPSGKHLHHHHHHVVGDKNEDSYTSYSSQSDSYSSYDDDDERLLIPKSDST
eukprot:CAMPEP_0174261966 /NCGR_PEP_ID=MMETSP0439-20130205/12693_1 /TAXON_ID=0 /ORGANISM="Stereomyxa ramosa, Strain Chinc5" /LENGTH=1154 /DNA_ID=CAMNT_0015346589 /DNA_START=54 /DNA_END=3518 /DNA_ORIENTATION=+